MPSPRHVLMLGALGIIIALSARAAEQPAAQASPETIAVSVGPCFGFCPVYKMSMAPAGAISFVGERHTGLLGHGMRENGSASYAKAAAALAPYRPETGSKAETTCEARISDQQHYQMTWTAPDGTVTTLDHDRGCRSGRNDMLNAVLDALPTQLGIEEWAREVRRPGVSRG